MLIKTDMFRCFSLDVGDKMYVFIIFDQYYIQKVKWFLKMFEQFKTDIKKYV